MGSEEEVHLAIIEKKEYSCIKTEVNRQAGSGKHTWKGAPTVSFKTLGEHPLWAGVAREGFLQEQNLN
jgi:hypothetical protein